MNRFKMELSEPWFFSAFMGYAKIHLLTNLCTCLQFPENV